MIDKKLFETRLNRIINLYDDLDNLIETLPVKLPEGAKEQVKKIIFSNKEINDVIAGFKERRPPRLILVGRTGVGKSSLINAIFGKYIAKTSPVEIGTNQLSRYNYEIDGDILFEVIDTRGIAESTNEKETTAEEDFKNAIEDFDPDAVLFLSDATERARMDEDVDYIKKLYKEIGTEIPLVTVLTHVDDLEPSRIKEPYKYTSSKLRNIQDKKAQMEKLLKNSNVACSTVIPVSTYIEWNKEDPHLLSVQEQQELTIDFDGRYNIDELIDFLENNIDFRASIYLMMTARIDTAIKKISNLIINGFSIASSTIALTPIPFSDIAILVPLQLILVIFIAYLSGSDIDKDTAKEFLLSIGGVGALGYGLRTFAQQGSKLLNLVLPGSGSAVSGTLAFSGTYAIGKTAQAYYIDKKGTEELDTIMKKASEEGKDKAPE
ncbi:GTPase [Bacillus thuringiensis]|uniref:GTPase n=1 Tax=Bacillus thuringiensis TaxID=1428 RepID=UPI000A3D1900|nr:GTPase [Bacillus thuringiensis]OUA54988.1 GTP-binding protein HSR1 [Bacillus thuringiensis serovar bolivia]OUA78327.1 GTP-binding protein HSR1 [Bacillus thuringiensis serovar pahangi]